MATPIKPFRRFHLVIQEAQEGEYDPLKETPKAHTIIEANGNPELFAKVGSFVRQFSEDQISEWRRRK